MGDRASIAWVQAAGIFFALRRYIEGNARASHHSMAN